MFITLIDKYGIPFLVNMNLVEKIEITEKGHSALITVSDRVMISKETIVEIEEKLIKINLHDKEDE